MVHRTLRALVRSLGLAVCLLLAQVGTAGANEIVRAFDAVVDIGANGTLDVVETIVVRSEGDQIRHGIFRDFPRFVTSDGKRGKVSFDVVSAECDGSDESWRTEPIEGGTRLYLGDKDVELEPGDHRYRIEYSTDRQIRFRDGYDELMWNVTGNGWQFPIENTTATVRLPSGAAPEGVAVYTGTVGETGRAARGRISGDKARFVATAMLMPGQGMTVDVRIPKGVVAPPTKGQLADWWWRDNLFLLIGWGGLAAVLIYFLVAWFRVGRDPPKGVIVPRWDPPEGMSPGLIGYVADDGFPDDGRKAFSASLLDLAVKGYVVIDNRKNAATIKRTDKAIAEKLPPGQAVLIGTLGNQGNALVIDRDHGEGIAALGERFRDAIERQYKDEFYHHNGRTFAIGVMLSIAVGLAFFLGTGLGDGDTMTIGVTAMIPLLAGVAVWRLVGSFRRHPSIFARLILLINIVVLAIVVIGLFLGLVGLFSDSRGIGYSFVAASVSWGLVVINLLFFALIGAPTKRGRAVKDGIEGLRTYLTLAEKDRMNMAGVPTMSPSHFEKLLPYAVVLDVERPWTQAFEGWLASASAAGATSYAPLWYGGNSADFSRSFGHLGTAMSSTIAASEPQPSSSSSFGSGSSGGGGGGGGGGGW